VVVVPRAARASLPGAFRAGSGKGGGVGRVGGRAAVAAGGAGGEVVAPTAMAAVPTSAGRDREGRGSRVSSKPRAAAECEGRPQRHVSCEL